MKTDKTKNAWKILSHFLKSLSSNITGAEVKGTIVEIKGDTALINFGYKTEGVVNRSELEDENVGDEVELSIVKMNNNGVFLSKKQSTLKATGVLLKKKKITVNLLKLKSQNMSILKK